MKYCPTRARNYMTKPQCDARGRTKTDRTHERDGLAPRRFASFEAAAEEAGISRLYGGIHFRSGIMQGLNQGRCIGQHAAALRTRSST